MTFCIFLSTMPMPWTSFSLSASMVASISISSIRGSSCWSRPPLALSMSSCIRLWLCFWMFSRSALAYLSWLRYLSASLFVSSSFFSSSSTRCCSSFFVGVFGVMAVFLRLFICR